MEGKIKGIHIQKLVDFQSEQGKYINELHFYWKYLLKLSYEGLGNFLSKCLSVYYFGMF